MADYQPCDNCGKSTHIDDLDGKPEPGSEDQVNFTRLECGDCYGPGYVSLRTQAEIMSET